MDTEREESDRRSARKGGTRKETIAESLGQQENKRTQGDTEGREGTRLGPDI